MTKISSKLVFSLLMVFFMAMGMSIYNTALYSGGLSLSCLTQALHTFVIEFPIAFILSFFIASKSANYLTLKLINPQNKPKVFSLCMSVFMVSFMVIMMSLVNTLLHNGLSMALPSQWLQSIADNFIAALPLQLCLAGPIVRKIFQYIMSINKQHHKAYLS